MTMSIRTYSELITIPSFAERIKYLRLDGVVGQSTFGFDRYLNQIFYSSPQWRSIRNQIIIRDNGCDLAIPGYDIHSQIYIHHMNPITVKDLFDQTEYLLNPEYLICTSRVTHNAIHYGDETIALLAPNERKVNDTCPWKH